jgi:hypothetical protein
VYGMVFHTCSVVSSSLRTLLIVLGSQVDCPINYAFSDVFQFETEQEIYSFIL